MVQILAIAATSPHILVCFLWVLNNHQIKMLRTGLTILIVAMPIIFIAMYNNVLMVGHRPHTIQDKMLRDDSPSAINELVEVASISPVADSVGSPSTTLPSTAHSVSHVPPEAFIRPSGKSEVLTILKANSTLRHKWSSLSSKTAKTYPTQNGTSTREYSRIRNTGYLEFHNAPRPDSIYLKYQYFIPFQISSFVGCQLCLYYLVNYFYRTLLTLSQLHLLSYTLDQDHKI